MARDKITEYSSTASENTVVGDVNIAENSALPSDMNNAVREVLSHQKEAFGSGTPLYVDQTNNRVGINKTPTVALDVSGSLSVDGGTIKLDGNHPVGSNNVALGDTALNSNVSGQENTAVGQAALYTNTGSYNTAVGRQALYYNTGAYNVAMGVNALVNNSTASNNTAVGYQAGYSNTSGTRLTAIGHSSLKSNTTGVDNTAVGCIDASAVGTLQANTTGTSNVAIGGGALQSNTEQSSNTAVGYRALQSSTGGSNTCIGRSSGSQITTGGSNTILGRYQGNSGGLDIRTSSNNIVLSDGDGNPHLNCFSDGRWYFGLSTSTNGHINLVGEYGSAYKAIAFARTTNGSEVGSIVTNASSTSYNTSSDYRLKENVVDMTGAIDRVKQLSPKRFNFIEDADTTVDGFLAHEAQTVIPEAVSGVKDAVDKDGNIDAQGIDQSKLVPLLTGALKEAIAKIEDLEARIATLENA